jgi:cobalt-zinc-cadmium efflux system protein
MMGSPDNISIAEIEEEILKIDRIQSLHHTHLWSLDGEQHVFTSHVKLNSVSNLIELIKVKKELSKIMKHYGFSYSTLELELDEESCRLTNNAQKQEQQE